MTEAREWWQSFFAGPWTAVQGQGYPAERTRSEVEFIVHALALTPGQRVLDVPCGEGRHAIELAARGFAVTGVDVNPAAIDMARQRAAERGVHVAFQQADMRALAFTGAFDAALCFYGSFGYFGEDDNLRCALALSRALDSGGKLLIDTHVMETLLPRFSQRGWGCRCRDADMRPWGSERPA